MENPKKTKRPFRWPLIAALATALLLLILLTTRISCNSVGSGGEDPTKPYLPDSAVVDSTRADSGAMVDTSKKDTAKNDGGEPHPDNGGIKADSSKKDTVEPHPPIDTVVKVPGDKKFATLGYHYSPEMNIHETQEINVFLSSGNLPSAIRDTLIKILQDEDPDRDPSDTGKIEFRERIPLYRFVTMDLVALDSGIVVRKTPDAPRQPVDTVTGNKWSWTVFANSAEKAESKLMLIVYSEDPSHMEKRIIHIRIHVERNFFRLFVNYLSEHPGDALFKILVPIVTFLGGLLAGKKRKKDTPDGESDESA